MPFNHSFFIAKDIANQRQEWPIAAMQHLWTSHDLRLATLMLTALSFASCGNEDSSSSTKSTCGNGVIEGRETCDDGNKVAGDGCSSSCRTEVAGACETGKQDNDHDNVCEAACPTTNACSNRGTCSDVSGHVVCTCTSPYGGSDCSGCAAGYQESGDTCIVGGGKTCETARPLDLTAAQVSGTTTGAGDETTPTCADSTDADTTFVFTVNGEVEATFALDCAFDALLHLRRTCAGADIACNDDTEVGNLNPTLITTLTAGTYYLFVDGWSGESGAFTLTSEFNCRAGSFDTETLRCTGDPCAADPCDAPRTCIPSDDWSAYACTCPTGTLDNGTECVDDACLPNPCTEAHKTRCTSDVSGNYTCGCSAGYIDDAGSCIPDPAGAAWTVMVFMNADNNLEEFGYADLNEMKSVGSTESVNIVVQFDSIDGTTKRLYVGDGTTTVIEDLGELDMGDYHTLADFGAWAIDAYPARQYELVLWDHGDGWKRTPTAPITKTFSIDDSGSWNSGISISNGDFSTALASFTAAAGRKLDLVGFDACLMGMWELTEAVRPYADWYNASEEVEPGDGWAYTNVMSALVANPEMTPLQLGSRIASTYVAQGDGFATMAVTQLSQVPALNTAITALADALLAISGSYSIIENVRAQSQSFDVPEMIDLGDFATRLVANTTLPQAIRDAATGVKSSLRIAIAINETESTYADATGLAIYLPARNYGMDPDYQGSAALWVDDTTWDEFVADFCQ